MALPWSFVSKITNSKHQIPNKSQTANSKPVQRAAQVLAPRERLFFFWDFEFRLLLFACPVK
jgi:hypothetical protein